MLRAGVVRVAAAVPVAEPPGLAAALIESDGAVLHCIGRTGFRGWTAAERALIDDGASDGAIEAVETAAAELLSAFPEAELLGFRGPQIAGEALGSGAVLAAVLGRPVVWDFRSADLRLGGRGGPLSPYFHHALARYLGCGTPLAVLTLGARAALSWVDPLASGPEAPGAVLAFDAGPAAPDPAGAGAPNAKAVARMLAAPYFLRMPPKALGVAEAEALAQALGLRATRATRIEAAAAAIARGFEHFSHPPARLLVAGAGRGNAALLARLAALLPCKVETVDAAGLPGDAFAACATAHLAIRAARGMATSGPSTTGVAAAVGGALIDRP
ncbi:anhydro-N-acetylmuramic acid kinase [Phaeovulum sp.]|uniref:anhydro-N-acetylmuramic acid kinase n=1 Tax=Phaeovulum sp. TaxID=2934796 RepID=UPI0035697711